MIFCSRSLVTPVFFLLFLMGGSSSFLCAAPVFLEGVSESSGWYDVNKHKKWDYGTPKPPGYHGTPVDDQLCWAASGSNILQWWQDKRSDISASTPNGPSNTITTMPNTVQLAIYQAMVKNWTNAGGAVEQGWNWWFNGGSLSNQPSNGSTLKNPSSGGYWSHLTAGSTSPLYTSYSFWANAGEKETFFNIFTSYIDNNWGSTLTLENNIQNTSHSITFWGYDKTVNGDLFLYLTDSDDYEVGMFKQKLSMSEGGYLYMEGVDGENQRFAYDAADNSGYTVTSIHGLTASLESVPEPGTVSLLVAASLSVFLRRRRKSFC